MANLMKLPGAIDYEGALLLDAIVRASGARTIVETGCGLSTYYLAKGLGSVGTDGKVYSCEIDPLVLEQVKGGIKGACLDGWCELHHGNALSFLLSFRKPIDLAFIDSDPSDSHVLQELDLIHRKLSPFGIIVARAGVCLKHAANYGLSTIQVGNLLIMQ